MIDYELIKRQVGEVLCHAANLSSIPALDEYMYEWEKNKARFIKLFHDQLILEMEEDVTFTLTEQEKEDKFDAFLKFTREDAYYRPDTINPDIIDFIQNNHDTFYDNQVSWAKDSSHIGMKLTRALKFYISDKGLLDSYQTELSRILQQNKLTGKLCLSVHPLDYLSSSENVSNWRSCHALDGEYAAGNLSYMMDSSTIICYLRSSESENYHLPHFPASIGWNNKKWRMLLHVNTSNNALMISRQYPFFTSEGPALVKQIYETVAERHFTDFTYKPFSNIRDYKGDVLYSLSEQYIIVRNKPIPLKNVVHQVKNSMNYNDVLYSTVCDPSMAIEVIPWYLEPTDIEPFEIGHEVKCLSCGNKLLSPDMGGMRCSRCAEPAEYCAYCGDAILDDDDIHWLNDEPYCDYCWDTHVNYCSHCQSYVVDDDMEHGMCKNCNKIEEEEGGEC